MVSKSSYLANWTPYVNKRYAMFIIITIVSLVLPFLKINGNHLFLLSFDKKQLHLMFTAFDMQEMYLMPFLLIMLFLGIFFLTTLGGRVWCGWTCPQTIFRVIYRDLIQTKLLGLRRSSKNKQKEPKPGNFIKKTVAILLWSILAFIAASNFLWYFVPPEDFIRYLQNPAEHTVLIGFLVAIALFLIYDVTILAEKFCIYVCPYARVQSVMYDDDTIQTIYNPNRGGEIYDEHGTLISSKPTGEGDECTGCEACVKVCPTHIDIRKGMQLECINCLECADACTKVMGALKKPSLITWTSPKEAIKGDKTQYFRFRIVAYIVAISIALGALIFMSGKKEYMLLNINRTTQLYNVVQGGERIENAYTFLFQNTSRNDHSYFFEVNNPDIKIKRPSEPFVLKAGKKVRKIVILYTDKKLADNLRKDVPLHINIKAYAVDNKEKVWVNRESTFVYPRQSEIDRYK